jgi:hypothetical protein
MSVCDKNTPNIILLPNLFHQDYDADDDDDDDDII